jgi:hypothetical protein
MPGIVQGGWNRKEEERDFAEFGQMEVAGVCGH